MCILWLPGTVGLVYIDEYMYTIPTRCHLHGADMVYLSILAIHMQLQR